MTDIANNISSLRKQIPSSVKIIAVSKTKPVNDIMIAYMLGQRCFGENRVQELLSKKDHLPSDIEWHLIGHLQTNKVRSIVSFIKMIHSVDSFKLLDIINSDAGKAGFVINCLLQFHIAKEETKFGFSMDEVTDMLESDKYKSFKNVIICGVMGMATFTGNMDIVRDEFRFLFSCFKTLKDKYFRGNSLFKEISMGMSSDYKVAIEEGSTMVRIGSLIFGERIHL
jgi:pyridoxal phosphate enzyme (YggS family)